MLFQNVYHPPQTFLKSKCVSTILTKPLQRWNAFIDVYTILTQLLCISKHMYHTSTILNKPFQIDIKMYVQNMYHHHTTFPIVKSCFQKVYHSLYWSENVVAEHLWFSHSLSRDQNTIPESSSHRLSWSQNAFLPSSQRHFLGSIYLKQTCDDGTHFVHAFWHVEWLAEDGDIWYMRFVMQRSCVRMAWMSRNPFHLCKACLSTNEVFGNFQDMSNVSTPWKTPVCARTTSVNVISCLFHVCGCYERRVYVSKTSLVNVQGISSLCTPCKEL